MRCPKCTGYLIQEVHYERELDAGSYRDWFARCYNCGLYLWRARAVIIVTALELTERVHIGVGKCVVEDCTNQVMSRNKSGFCRTCGHALYNWERAPNRKNMPQPLIRQPDGRWVKNPSSLTWRRHTTEYAPQRATGGKRPCICCGRVKFIRKDGMCGKCLHANRPPAPCGQCGATALLSEQGICTDCAASNMVANWLAAGKRNPYLKPLKNESEPQRYERLLAAALKKLNGKRRPL